MNNQGYYYVVASLPRLSLDDNTQRYRLDNFIADAHKLLCDEHMGFVCDILCSYDVSLIIDALLGLEKPRFNRAGNYTFDKIKRSLESGEYIFDNFINKFLIEYNRDKKEKPLNRAELQDSLMDKFYEKMINHPNRFIREYFLFDRNLRNILVALNKRKFKDSLDDYVGSQEEDDVIISLKESSQGDFGLSHEIDYLAQLIEHFQNDDIVTLEKYIDELRWNKIDAINTFNYFEIDMILGYLIKFMLVERWFALDPKIGHDIFAEKTNVVLASNVMTESK